MRAELPSEQVEAIRELVQYYTCAFMKQIAKWVRCALHQKIEYKNLALPQLVR